MAWCVLLLDSFTRLDSRIIFFRLSLTSRLSPSAHNNTGRMSPSGKAVSLLIREAGIGVGLGIVGK